MDAELFETNLAARNYVYTVLSLLLGEEPEEARFGAIDVDLLAESLEVLGVDGSELVGTLRGKPVNEGLRREYMRCFVGPQKLPVPLWESATRTGEDALFQEITLNVRKAYRSCGFIPAHYPHVPDDHIALELDFMRVLAAQALVAECKESRRAALETSGRFVQNHLGKWAHTFAARLRASGESDFYACAAEAAASLAKADEAFLAA